MEDATAAEISAAVEATGVATATSVREFAQLLEEVNLNHIPCGSRWLMLQLRPSLPAPISRCVPPLRPAAKSIEPRSPQTFTGDVGGTLPPAVTAGGRGFIVTGSDDFVGVGAALQHSCDIQPNACANAANSGTASGVTVADCDVQV